jgi:hypothetical protein
MKTAEDEAFEDIERRQGGGFPAKRAMAADKIGPFEKWWYYEGSCPPYTHHDCEEHTKRMCKIAWSNGAYVAAQPVQEPGQHWSDCVEVPLYTTPPQRPWVGMTLDEIEELFQIAAGADEETDIRFARLIEAKIREKNA